MIRPGSAATRKHIMVEQNMVNERLEGMGAKYTKYNITNQKISGGQDCCRRGASLLAPLVADLRYERRGCGSLIALYSSQLIEGQICLRNVAWPQFESQTRNALLCR